MSAHVTTELIEAHTQRVATRPSSHMRITDLADVLSECMKEQEKDLPAFVDLGDGAIWTPENGLDSYRGYYDQAAFGYYRPVDDARITPTSLLVDDLRRAVGATFTGYKGGDYTMDHDTKVWFSQYGACDGYYPVGVRVFLSPKPYLVIECSKEQW